MNQQDRKKSHCTDPISARLRPALATHAHCPFATLSFSHHHQTVQRARSRRFIRLSIAIVIDASAGMLASHEMVGWSVRSQPAERRREAMKSQSEGRTLLNAP